ncbi:MAG: ribosome recycling factor [Parcubacteria group bacterium]|jgi:ribosome recycling factor
MYKGIIEKKKPDMDKSIEHYVSDIGQLSTGRASASMLDSLMVDYYGAKNPLKQVASVTTPEPRTIVIAPWDKGNLVNIEKAIRESQLNFNPNNDGQVIRINIPALTEERRKEIVKLLNQKTEEAKISIRKHREEAWDEIQRVEKEGLMGEDDKFIGKEKLQEVIDEYNKKIEAIGKKKEEEIMTI